MDAIAGFFEANRAELERAISSARLELEACRARCRQLEEQIRSAETILGHAETETTRLQPTLRAAMRIVLSDEPAGLAAPEIARRIAERGLYLRPNGAPIDVGQIHNRVFHYPAEFVRDAGRIRLRGTRE